MDSLLSFPVEDNHLQFQAGGDGYDFPIFDDLLLEQMLDVVGWECASSFGSLADANPNGNLLAEAISGGGEGAAVKPRRDRSKTIASERKRRGRMKEKLYELRSMVPNITKMDKASIIADAVAYVQELQGQEKKLAEEIRILESSPASNSACNRRTTMKAEKSRACRGKILGVVAHQVGERRVQVKIGCSREEGASSSLYNAVHALQRFRLESSAMACTSDQYICTSTFDCRGMWEEEMTNAGRVRCHVMDSLLKEGFPFVTNSTSSAVGSDD